MRAVAAIEAFGPVEKANSGAWIAVAAVLFVLWAGLLVFLSRRSMQRARTIRRAADFAARYGGPGDGPAGGHQAVAPLLVAAPVAIGRLTPAGRRRVALVVDAHSFARDPIRVLRSQRRAR